MYILRESRYDYAVISRYVYANCHIQSTETGKQKDINLSDTLVPNVYGIFKNDEHFALYPISNQILKSLNYFGDVKHTVCSDMTNVDKFHTVSSKYRQSYFHYTNKVWFFAGARFYFYYYPDEHMLFKTAKNSAKKLKLVGDSFFGYFDGAGMVVDNAVIFLADFLLQMQKMFPTILEGNKLTIATTDDEKSFDVTEIELTRKLLTFLTKYKILR